MITTALTAILIMFGLALAFSAALVIANVKLAVHVDPRQQELMELLPQANCGGCGYPSCAAYAKAVHQESAPVNRCTVGGPSIAERLATVMGVELQENFPYRPVIHCSAKSSDRLKQGHYVGEASCSAANVVGGVQGCTYGCLGFGDCVAACEYNAMEMIDGLPRINYDNCVGCGGCVRACPRNLIEQIPFKVDRMLVVGCASHDPAKTVREVCRVGCIGCGLCARKQPQVFEMQDNLATIHYERYTGQEDFGPAVEKCPMESLVTFGKPSPRHQQQLAEVDEVVFAGRPVDTHCTSEDLDWRG
jgi:electron transport complex protein RnfB